MTNKKYFILGLLVGYLLIASCAALRFSEIPSDFSSRYSRNTGLIEVSWSPIDWADQYQFEWTYVNDYSPTGFLRREELTYDFKNNNTRVIVNEPFYNFPLIFEHGYVIWRARGVVYMEGDSDKPVYGRWSGFIERGAIASLPTEHFYFVESIALHEDDRKNWQYIATYAEEGKRTDNIDYLDGTMRNRQSVSRINTIGRTIVGETIYDHIGRTAIQVMPSPLGLPRTSINSKLEYHDYFNQNPDGYPYAWRDFEVAETKEMNAASGASKYYSPSNENNVGHQKYVPVASGFPFSQTEYMPDKTGRVRRQGGVGPTYQLGSGHELKYYYGVPAQEELDRLFGNDAGYAEHYRKTMVLDANRQALIEYLDAKGNTIATALGGETPENLLPIDFSPNTIVMNFLEDGNQVNRERRSLISSKSFLVTTDSTNYDFNYQLVAANFEDNACENICYDCIYDLRIQLRDEEGTILENEVRQLGTLDNACDQSLEDRVVHLFSKNLGIGSYALTKELQVNEASIESYINQYLEENRSCLEERRLRIRRKRERDVDISGCDVSCEDCEQTISNAVERAADELVIVDGELQSREFNRDDINDLEEGCKVGCSQGPLLCESAYNAMLTDVSPGGQYALYRDSTRLGMTLPNEVNPVIFPLSILNSENLLPNASASWKTPAKPYLNEDGTPSRIHINSDGLPAHDVTKVIDGYIAPQDLDYVEDFIMYWQSQWATSLLPFHPEYCYYTWCIEHTNSHLYDELLVSTITFQDAVDQGLINLSSRELPIFNSDPFFDTNPAWRTAMQEIVDRYPTETGRDYSLTELAYAMSHCDMFTPTRSEMDACISGFSRFGTGTDEINNLEWDLLKNLYLAQKRQLQEQKRQEQIVGSPECFSNDGIGFGLELGGIWNIDGLFPYKDKDKRFARASDVDLIIEERTGESLESLSDRADFVERYHNSFCQKCPLAAELESLLNKVVVDQNLTSNFEFNNTYPITRRIVSALGGTGNRFFWRVENVGRTLVVTLDSDTGSKCSLRLRLPSNDISWTDIQGLSCLDPVDPHSPAATDTDFRPQFTMSARIKDDVTIQVLGASSCFDVLQCQNTGKVCEKSDLSDDLLILFTHLFQGEQYLNPTYQLRGRGITTDYFSDALAEVVPGAVYNWHYGGSSGPQSFGARIAIERAVNIENCPFSFTIVDSEETFNGGDITIEDILLDSNATVSGCTLNQFILVARKEGRRSFKIRVENSCYATGDCCPDYSLCCLEPTPTRPYENPCEIQAREAIDHNIKIEWDLIMNDLRDSLRVAYTDRCLQATERFTATYNDNLYQFTLMYYDQANNLVKTVPPSGVQPILLNSSNKSRIAAARRAPATTPSLYPSHTMQSDFAFNTLNNVTSKNNPDGGTTRFWYDKLGRIAISQEARQVAEKQYNYLLYDVFGRIKETGQLLQDLEMTERITADDLLLANWISIVSDTKSDITKNFYDMPMIARINDYFGTEGQQYLRKNLATAATYEQFTLDENDYDYATHFSYDIHGNVKTLIQENPMLESLSQNIKKIDYKYDLISSNVNQVVYQEGHPDQFYHRYEYDKDNTLTKVYTGTNGVDWEQEAKYLYYEHGPLARMELGNGIQGIDYAYNLQGWLKGINSANLSPLEDIGQDGIPGIHSSFAKDVVGYSLEYFTGDYRPIHATASLLSRNDNPKNLFDGNIASVVLGIEKFMEEDNTQQTSYEYDQLKRLRSTRVSDLDELGNLIPKNDYAVDITYDGSGNFLSLKRNAHINPTTTWDGMDNLNYIYEHSDFGYAQNTNRLKAVQDLRTTTTDFGDIQPGQHYNVANPTDDNYQYDASGNLVADRQEGITSINWNAYGKVETIIKADSARIEFKYDAFGNRVGKTTYKGIDASTTHYILDASGLHLAIYQQTDSLLQLTEQSIYGPARLGVRKDSVPLWGIAPLGSPSLGGKWYEIQNHVGNVITMVANKKDTEGNAIVKSASDYFPFGMEMPGRSWMAKNIRYGFHGMEKDDDTKGPGNSHSTLFRQYDPRIGKWLSLDPKMDKYLSLSPYSSFLNNPITITDPYGDDPPMEFTASENLTEREQERQKRLVIFTPTGITEGRFPEGYRVTIEARIPDNTVQVYDRQEATINAAGDAVFQLILPETENVHFTVIAEDPNGDPSRRFEGIITEAPRPGEHDYLRLQAQVQIITHGSTSRTSQSTTRTDEPVATRSNSESFATRHGRTVAIPNPVVVGQQGGVSIGPVGANGGVTLAPTITTYDTRGQSTQTYGEQRRSRTTSRSTSTTRTRVTPRIIGTPLRFSQPVIGRRYDRIRIPITTLGPMVYNPRTGLWELE